MEIRMKIFIILISSLLFMNIVNSIDNINFYNNSCPYCLYDTKTYELKYDDSNQDDGYAYPSVFIAEPFDNGWGFHFNLDDFDIFNYINTLKIEKISVYIIGIPSYTNIDKESRQVMCSGIGGWDGPKDPDDVFFAVPHGGIPTYIHPFEGWLIFTEKDGSWGKDDGAKFDYSGLPVTIKKEECKNEYGYWLWVALTQVKSDGQWDNDVSNFIGCDRHVGHHCFRSEGNYKWIEYNQSHTCLIHLFIEYEIGPGIDNSSIGVVKTLFK